MSGRTEPKSATTTAKIITIAMTLTALLILDVFLANVVFVTESSETLRTLLFVEGVVFIITGALLAVRGSDTPMDVLVATRRGVPPRAEPLREGYAGKKITEQELMIDVVLVVIGIILIFLAFVFGVA